MISLLDFAISGIMNSEFDLTVLYDKIKELKEMVGAKKEILLFLKYLYETHQKSMVEYDQKAKVGKITFYP